MKIINRKNLLTALSFIVLGFLIGLIVGIKRGIPFITEREQWTIGIYRGKTPFLFDNPLNRLNPILKAEHVTDVSAKFVADPFLIRDSGTWYLFFEVYNNDTSQGDLAVATSQNSWFWDYEQVVLDEPFHLSYPYVFEWQGEYYLIPESYEANSVRLYKAIDFPTKWSYVSTLVDGADFVDNSIVFFDQHWWLFAATTENDTLYLFHSENLAGPWFEHPSSPIVKANNHKARPSGRIIVYDDRLFRYTMDVKPSYGTHQVFAYEITNITETSYSERLAQDNPVLFPRGSGWNSQAMHQVDPIQLREDDWIAAVDGFGKYWIFGLEY